MTLQECFDLISNNPTIIVYYFCALPLTAILSGELDRKDGHLSPWKYVYSALVFLAAIPGMAALLLNVYLFLFEKQHNIMSSNIFTQILPIVSMIITLWIVKKNVNLDLIPGFGKLSSFLLLMLGIMAIMWVLDSTRLVMFSYLPFQWVGLLLVAVMLMIWFAFKKLAN